MPSAVAKTLALIALVAISAPASAAGTAATVMSNATIGTDAARNASGRTVLVWDAGSEIYARVFGASGTPLTNDLRLTNSSRYDNRPQVTVLPDGRFVVAWVSMDSFNVDEQKLLARWYSSAGIAETDEIVVKAIATGDDIEYPAMGSSADGTVAIAYKLQGNSSRDGYLQRYSSVGDPVGDLVTDLDGRESGYDFEWLDMDRADDGRMVIVYDGADGAWFRLLNADGTPVDVPAQVNTTPVASFFTRLAVAPDGRFAVVWNQNSGSFRYVIARGFDADGTPASGEVAVSPVPPSDGAMVYDIDQAVAIDAAGNFTVAFARNDHNDDASTGDYTTHYDAWIRSFSRTGVEIGGITAIADDPSVHEFSPVLGFDATGGGMLFWEQGTSLASNPAVRAQFTSVTATDVSLSVLAPTVRKHRGDKVKFTYTVSNAGPTAAADVSVVFTAPIQFRPLSALLGTTPCAISGQTVTCTVGTLAGGTSRTGSVTVKALKVGTFALAASATTTSMDVDATDNAASTSKRIRK